MRNLMLACAAVAAVSGVISVNLWRELRDERVLSADLRGQLQLAEERAAAASRSAMAPMPVTAPAVAQAATAASETPASVAAAPPAAAANPNATRNLLLNRQEMMQDPEYRKARLAQTRMSMPMNYPGLIEELGLTPEEADQLFDLLAGSQLEMSDALMATATINGVAPDPEAAQQAMQRRQELQAKQDEALMAMLGGGRYAQWQDYQQTRGARQQVMQLGQTLSGMGMPLSATQSKPLTAAYVAEQRRQQEDSQRMIASMRQTGGTIDQERMMEESLRMQTESNRRLVDAARPHLSQQQLETLQASLDQQLAMNRASSRAARRQIEMQGGQAPPVLPAPGVIVDGPVSIVIRQ